MTSAATLTSATLDLTRSTDGADDRIADAALRCIAETGVTATTVEAIAREAGVGRATVYRHFPGGRAEVVLAAGHRELERFAELLEPDFGAATTLEDLLAAAVHGAVHGLRTSAALTEILSREPELVLPHLSFDRMPEVFVVASELLGPHLRRFVADERAVQRIAELVTRIVLSYEFLPPADVDLGDRESVRAHLRRYVLPGLTAP